MATDYTFTSALRMTEPAVRKWYELMTDDRKRIVVERYLKHAIACKRSLIEPEPRFLVEIVTDVRAGNEGLTV